MAEKWKGICPELYTAKRRISLIPLKGVHLGSNSDGRVTERMVGAIGATEIGPLVAH